ncbi:pro-sigmaK processing inhibitor BofA family protein [Anaerovorax odorimutans]|uniref:pro-sigmaK processing inhibitor BofA family protein n=1 Tax=Anaerovorax odorimutans TaxID=109327 RepID=UPI00042294FB|nr:pro-sigmaK processing inhibitor BofA family protein [Anaerovorax odorimutans]
MDMSLEIGILIAYAFGIFALYIIGYLFLVPLKILLKLIINSILGGIFIVIVNLAGQCWDLHIPLNLLSAVIVGILGIPGALLLMFF